MKKIRLALAFAGFAIIWPKYGHADCEVVDDKPAAGKVDFEFPIEGKVNITGQTVLESCSASVTSGGSTYRCRVDWSDLGTSPVTFSGVCYCPYGTESQLDVSCFGNRQSCTTTTVIECPPNPEY